VNCDARSAGSDGRTSRLESGVREEVGRCFGVREVFLEEFEGLRGGHWDGGGRTVRVKC